MCQVLGIIINNNRELRNEASDKVCSCSTFSAPCHCHGCRTGDLCPEHSLNHSHLRRWKAEDTNCSASTSSAIREKAECCVYVTYRRAFPLRTAEFLMHSLKVSLPVPLNSSVLNCRKWFDISAFLSDVNRG